MTQKHEHNWRTLYGLPHYVIGGYRIHVEECIGCKNLRISGTEVILLKSKTRMDFLRHLGYTSETWKLDDIDSIKNTGEKL